VRKSKRISLTVSEHHSETWSYVSERLISNGSFKNKTDLVESLLVYISDLSPDKIAELKKCSTNMG
jgi:hypothetical protein